MKGLIPFSIEFKMHTQEKLVVNFGVPFSSNFALSVVPSLQCLTFRLHLVQVPNQTTKFTIRFTCVHRMDGLAHLLACSFFNEFDK